MSVIATVFVAYLLILAALAMWSRKETQTMSGYFIAGKSLPPWVVAFSTNATGEIIGMVGGFSTTVFWVLYMKPYTHDLLEIIPGFIDP